MLQLVRRDERPPGIKMQSMLCRGGGGYASGPMTLEFPGRSVSAWSRGFPTQSGDPGCHAQHEGRKLLCAPAQSSDLSI